MAGDVGVGFEFLAELDDVGIDGAGIGEGFIAPDGVEDLIAGEGAIGILEEVDEEVVLGGGELDLLAAAGDDAAVDVDFGIGELEDLGLFGGGAAQEGANAGEELAAAEGFDDIVVGADFEEEDFVDLVADGGEDEDGGADVGAAELFADFGTGHAGEAEVDDEEVGLQGEGLVVAGPAVGGDDDAVTFLFEHDRDGVGEALVVVDYENGLHPIVRLYYGRSGGPGRKRGGGRRVGGAGRAGFRGPCAGRSRHDMRCRMTRRDFAGSLMAAAGARGAGGARITRIRLAPVEGRFHKFVAMNAYDTGPKGHTYENTLLRVATDQGVEGVGVMSYGGPDAAYVGGLRSLLGANPLELYTREDGRITGRGASHGALLAKYKHLDGALFDLAGKLSGQPVWRLLGAPVRERVEAYDGTLYFSDIWFRDRGVRAVVEEAEEAQKKGYRGIKLKLGRGWKWMEKEEGLRRDIEVARAVRKAVGPEMKIMADANNGYGDDMERAWKLMAETAEANLFWMEEIFPETVKDYSELRARMRRAGIKTLIADGESTREAGEFAPFLKPARLIDVLQMDIRTGGFVENAVVAGMAEAAGGQTAPHNWGSQMGVLLALQFARAVKGVLGAEDDRSTCDAIVAEGYEFRDGYYTVPDGAGMSVRVNEEVYRRKCQGRETVIE